MKKLLKNNKCFLFAAIFLGATACNETTVYHSYRSIPAEGWRKGDTLFFDIPVRDSLLRLDLSAEVRNNNSYAYRNLYIAVCHNPEDSAQWQCDTLMLSLADQEGKWNGTGWSSLFQTAFPIGTIAVQHPGNYTLKITHEMQDERLKGISDIGIKAVASQPAATTGINPQKNKQ